MQAIQSKTAATVIFGFLLTISGDCDAHTMPDNQLKRKINILSIDLNQYQPVGQTPRYYQVLDGSYFSAPARTEYFQPAELYADLDVRLTQISQEIEHLQPDLVVLQRVAASTDGLALTPSCHAFNRRGQESYPHLATIWRLSSKLHGRYIAAASCSGKTSLRTREHQFQHRRIITFRNEEKEVVHDFDSSPFDDYRLIEGFGVLVRSPWRLERNSLVHLAYNSNGATTPVNLAIIRAPRQVSSKWFVIVNLEMGHKLRHFEQAVAIRQLLDQYVASLGEPDQFGGVVVVGMLNASLFRPNPTIHSFAEVSAVPWEVYVENQYDFRSSRVASRAIRRDLELHLGLINNHQFYKPWAKILPDHVARGRIRETVGRFIHWQEHRVSHQIAKKLIAAIDTSKEPEFAHQKASPLKPNLAQRLQTSYTLDTQQMFFTPNLSLTEAISLDLCPSLQKPGQGRCHAIMATLHWENEL